MNRGLLQISKESANQPGYSCDIKKAKHLHDPAVHLPCAVKILSTWVSADHVIASYKRNKKTRGGGRYWAVLQEKKWPPACNIEFHQKFVILPEGLIPRRCRLMLLA
jgi:hypothetical protein